MKARETVESYVFRHYGNLTTVGDIVYEDETGKWIAELKSDYPRMITDDKTGAEPVLKFIPMPKIGTVVFDANWNVLEATPRSECGDKIWDRLTLWRETAERIMVEASADQLANVRGADQFLSPVGTILDNLRHPLHDKPIIYKEDIEGVESTKYQKYLSLLSDLNVVEPVTEGWVCGPLFVTLLEQSIVQKRDFFKVVIAYLLQKRYSSVRDILHIGRFEKLIHLDNSYYWYALEAEELLHFERRGLFSRYRVQYNDEEADNFTLNSTLQELSQVEALRVEQDFCIGNDKIFAQMLTIKHKVAELGFPVA
jgi:hypothetical protein